MKTKSAVWELNTKPGDKVECVNHNHSNRGSCDRVEDSMAIGLVSTIEKIEIHPWYAKLHLKGFPNKVFNSINFEPFTE